MMLFVNVSNFIKWYFIYNLAFDVAHWDAWDDSFVL